MSYDSVLAIFGSQEPITVPVSWGTVIVHSVTVSKYVDAISEVDEKPIYNMLAMAVQVDGEYWTATQWASLPKKSMKDISDIYDAYKTLNGNDEEGEKK